MEMTLVIPAVLLLLFLVVLAGRVAGARIDVYGAAADAARAASMRQHPGAALADARETAEASLAGRGVTCRTLAVDVDTGAFAPGGSVAVSVRCRVALSDLSLLGVPGSVDVAGRATEIIDEHRSE